MDNYRKIDACTTDIIKPLNVGYYVYLEKSADITIRNLVYSVLKDLNFPGIKFYKEYKDFIDQSSNICIIAYPTFNRNPRNVPINYNGYKLYGGILELEKRHAICAFQCNGVFLTYDSNNLRKDTRQFASDKETVPGIKYVDWPNILDDHPNIELHNAVYIKENIYEELKDFYLSSMEYLYTLPNIRIDPPNYVLEYDHVIKDNIIPTD